MIVVRVGGHKDNSILSSCPCSNCLMRLKCLGFDKIVYIDNNGVGCTDHITTMETTHKSKAQKRFVLEGWL